MAALTFDNVYVFGAGGMLGRALAVELERRRGGRPVVLYTDVNITNEEDVRRSLAKATDHDLIINAAAMTNVDRCENYRDDAFAANAWGARNVALGCYRPLAAGFPTLVHISTGAVFDGLEPVHADLDGYDEFVHPRPLSVYAKTKYAGEELVRTLRPSALIIRLGHLYGPGGKNGLSTARARILRSEGIPIDGGNKIGPTYVADAARAVLDIAAVDGIHRTIHVAPENWATAFQFASRLRDKLPGPGTGRAQIFSDQLVYPSPGELGHTTKLPGGTFAWRAPFQVIRSSLLVHHGVAPIGPWEEGLDRYLKDEASS